MFDRNAPSTLRALAEYEKSDVRDKLARYASWRTTCAADADDLLADAIECVGDPQRKPWDPAKGSFFRHMRLVMDDVAIELARSGYRQFEEINSKLAFNKRTVDPAPLADAVLGESRELARLRRLGNLLVANAVHATFPQATVRRLPRTRLVALLAAAAIGVLAIAVVIEHREVVALFHREVPREHNEPVDALAVAKTLRHAAFEACEKAEWAECEDYLDQAKKLDPSGEADDRVTRARQTLYQWHHPPPAPSRRYDSK